MQSGQIPVAGLLFQRRKRQRLVPARLVWGKVVVQYSRQIDEETTSPVIDQTPAKIAPAEEDSDLLGSRPSQSSFPGSVTTGLWANPGEVGIVEVPRGL